MKTSSFLKGSAMAVVLAFCAAPAGADINPGDPPPPPPKQRGPERRGWAQMTEQQKQDFLRRRYEKRADRKRTFERFAKKKAYKLNNPKKGPKVGPQNPGTPATPSKS